MIPFSYPRTLVRRLYFAYKYGAKVCSAKVSFNSVIEKGSYVASGCVVAQSKIGKYSYLNRNAEVLRTEVGPFCSFGQSCLVNPNEHLLFLPTSCEALYDEKLLELVAENNHQKTFLGPDVWVGARAVVLKGVTVGVGSVIAAGAIVTKDVPPYGIAKGIPAKIESFRFAPESIEALLNSQWWNYPVAIIRKALTVATMNSKHIQPIEFLDAINKLSSKQ